MLIAGTHSGAGKTTVTGVVLRALHRRGLRVQAFKLGPDFIDPGYHAEATGRPSINLDVWMVGEEGVRRTYSGWSAGADISVIEAMGALYDGHDGSGWGSAAHVARLLGVPVVVVVDVWGMTRTTGAILDGLLGFDPEVPIAGCVLNRVGSRAHARMVVEALPERLRPLVLGSIEHHGDLAVAERHLGLVTVDEQTTGVARRAAQTQAAELLDVDRLVAVAGGATTAGGCAGERDGAVAVAVAPVARLAVARDAAFCFYYEENLVLLRRAGFELVAFRPTVDAQLPPDVDAVYLGGGYPESFARELAANTSLAAELRERVAAGLVVYAECGGLVYLGRSLTGFDGVRHPMSGVLPIDVAMDPDHLAIRYVEVRTRAASPLGPAGVVARGQEFHQSRLVAADIDPTLYEVIAGTGPPTPDGYQHRGVVASYVHLHLGSNEGIAAHLVRSAVAARRPDPGHVAAPAG